MDLYSAGVQIEVKPEAPADAVIGLAPEMTICGARGADLKVAFFNRGERVVTFAPFSYISKHFQAKERS
jgi:hypothetical protein